MEGNYIEGEEKFGPVTSRLYSLGRRFPQIRRFYEFVIMDISGTKFRSLLDIGTGPGAIPIVLSKGRVFKDICAVDPSPHMVKIARRNAKGLPIKFEIGSSRRIPFKRKFGVIIATLSFHHWKEREKALSYLSTFLDKNGEIRIYEFDKGKRRGLLGRFASGHSISEKEMENAARISRLRIKDIRKNGEFLRVSFSKAA